MKATMSAAVTMLVLLGGSVSTWGAEAAKASLGELLKGHSGKAMTIRIDKPVAVLKDCRVPENVTLRFSRGGYLDIADKVALAVNGGIEAGPYQIIRGSWKLRGVPRIECIYPEWFYDGKYNDESSDWAPAINQAIRWGAQGPQGVRRVVLQNRRYNVNSTVNLCMEPKKGRIPFGSALEGQVRCTEYRAGTQLIGNTGEGNAVIEASNVDGISLRNVGVVRGNINPSSIGILQVRGAGKWAGDHNYENVYVNMGSNPSSNGNFGTIGVLNVAGEETKWHNLQVWANLPLVLSYTSHLYRVRGDFSGVDRYTVKSLIGATTKGSSNTVFRMTGMGRLISYDFVSPCLLINAAGTVDMGSAFMQKRMHRVTRARKGKTGVHFYPVEIWHCDQYKHFGCSEGARGYMINCGTLQLADVNMRVAPKREKNLPVIALYYKNGMNHIIQNGRFVFDIHDVDRPLMAYWPPKKELEHPNRFRIFNNEFRTNQPYNATSFVDVDLLRVMSDNVMAFKGGQVRIGRSSIHKEFSKTVLPVERTQDLVKIHIPSAAKPPKPMVLSTQVEGVITGIQEKDAAAINYRVSLNGIVSTDGKVHLKAPVVTWDNAVSTKSGIITKKLRFKAVVSDDQKMITLKLVPPADDPKDRAYVVQGAVKLVWNGETPGKLFLE